MAHALFVVCYSPIHHALSSGFIETQQPYTFLPLPPHIMLLHPLQSSSSLFYPPFSILHPPSSILILHLPSLSVAFTPCSHSPSLPYLLHSSAVLSHILHLPVFLSPQLRGNNLPSLLFTNPKTYFLVSYFACTVLA